MWIKWKLLVTTLPMVALVLAVKLALELGLGFGGFVDFSDVSMVLTGGVFLIGFMLAGVMSDYKESEKLPGEVACALETLEEQLVQATVQKPSLDAGTMRQAMLQLTNQIRAWLFRQVPDAELFASLSQFNEVIHRLEREGAGGYAAKGLGELHNLRKHLTRIGVISRTGFLSSGYALLETLTAVILILAVAARFKSMLAEVILVPFISLVYLYMVRLIRDLDDPFEYSTDGRTGAAEVDLFPIDEYRTRLSDRIVRQGK